MAGFFLSGCDKEINMCTSISTLSDIVVSFQKRFALPSSLARMLLLPHMGSQTFFFLFKDDLSLFKPVAALNTKSHVHGS